ncbi:MAG: hypothetical protein HQK72_11265 [Desulfamplus sp.]|nr:hypothetical protein [Desulfamplus sp.]
MEFYEGFKWAVPKNFKDAVANCFFEEGDMLYNTPIAYEGKWGDAVKHIEHALQVQLPKSGTVIKTTDEEKSRFAANWNSLVKIHFLIGGGDYNNQLINTTQGRLFTFLRTGSFAILNPNTSQPQPPLLARELQSKLRETSIINAISNDIIKKNNNQNIYIVPYDETSTLWSQKADLGRYCLINFQPIIIEKNPSEIPFLLAYDFHPLLSLKIILFEKTSPEILDQTIKKRMVTLGYKESEAKTIYKTIEKQNNYL